MKLETKLDRTYLRAGLLARQLRDGSAPLEALDRSRMIFDAPLLRSPRAWDEALFGPPPDLEAYLWWLLAQNCGGHDQGGVYGRSRPAVRFTRDGAVFSAKTVLEYGMTPGQAYRIRIDDDKRWLLVQNLTGRFVTQMAPGKNGAALLEPVLQRDMRELLEAAHGTEPFTVKFETDGFCHVHRPGSTCYRLRVGTSLKVQGGEGMTLLEKFPQLRLGTVPLEQAPPPHDNYLVGPLKYFMRLGERNRGPFDEHRLEKLMGISRISDLNDTIDDLPPEHLFE